VEGNKILKTVDDKISYEGIDDFVEALKTN